MHNGKQTLNGNGGNKEIKVYRRRAKEEWKGDEKAHPREKSKKAVLLGPGRIISNLIKNRKEIAHNFLTSQKKSSAVAPYDLHRFVMPSESPFLWTS